MVVENIFEIDALDELRSYLQSSPTKKTRAALLREFWKVCRYTNAEEWNRAVRLCESLAIVGWGDCEAVEAYCGGDWTAFKNRFDERRFVTADWSKRKAGVTIAPGRATYYASPDRPEETGDFPTEVCVQNLKLATQRNWIPKNPIRLYQWLDSSDGDTRKLLDSVNDDLAPALDLGMQPEQYGSAINQIWIDFYFCTRKRGCEHTFVVIEEDSRLSSVQLHKRLLTMYPAAQIERERLFLRKRYDYGAFQSEKGEIKATLHFPQEFNQLSLPAQKKEFAQRLSAIVSGVVERLDGRGLEYNFQKMQADFEAILEKWRKRRS
jgi:hypothetical protein